MNNRRRKKWLKQHGEYINPRECGNLDCTFAEFALPRLKYFKTHTLGYPGREGAETPVVIFSNILKCKDYFI